MMKMMRWRIWITERNWFIRKGNDGNHKYIVKRKIRQLCHSENEDNITNTARRNYKPLRENHFGRVNTALFLFQENQLWCTTMAATEPCTHRGMPMCNRKTNRWAWMIEWMNEWMNECWAWIKEWMILMSMNEWMNERMKLEHALCFCSTFETLQAETWSEGTCLDEMLYGPKMAVRRTAEFMQQTNLTI